VYAHVLRRATRLACIAPTRLRSAQSFTLDLVHVGQQQQLEDARQCALFSRPLIFRGFTCSGNNHGFTFHPIEADPKKIIASMRTGHALALRAHSNQPVGCNHPRGAHAPVLSAGIKMDVPDSCSVEPYTGRHTCTGPQTQNLSADGFLSNRQPKVTGW
jgi:hypothetical protein